MPDPEAVDAGTRRTRSFATKLLAGGLVLAITLISSVSAFLIVSRNRQTTHAAQTNADNRASVVRKILQNITAPVERSAGVDFASLNIVHQAFTKGDPATNFTFLLNPNSPRIPLLTRDDVVLAKADGTIVYATSTLASKRDALGTLPSLKKALQGFCSDGVELIAGNRPAYDLAVPIAKDLTVQPCAAPLAPSAILGVVVYSAALTGQLSDMASIVGYPTAFIADDGSGTIYRLDAGKQVATTSPQDITAAIARHDADVLRGDSVVTAAYSVSGVGDVIGSFVAMTAPDGRPGYVGVEVPLKEFVGNQQADELVVLLIAITAIVVTTLVVLVFVHRVVRRPVSNLMTGVSRIAGGDYASDIQATSQDELGVLAGGVNRMRRQIKTYVEHIDGAVTRLHEVSRALTTTTDGVGALQAAVLSAAAAIAGGGAETMLFIRREGVLVPVNNTGGTRQISLDGIAISELLAGRSIRALHDGLHLLGVPMFYQNEVYGALAITSPVETADSDERALAALANNAAIALENTRLYELEKETVKQLRELNAMKSDFLSTAQHELRTPVLAIMGQLELIGIAWTQFDDEAKLGIIKDIEISTRLLSELLETIIDFSLITTDAFTLRLGNVVVLDVVGEAVEEVRQHYREKLPVTLTIDVPSDMLVNADRARLRQVLRSLLDNAVKFTPENGDVRVMARVNALGGVCTIEVLDNGIGISPEALPKVWDRFFQEDNSKTRKYGGMGMGLALVKLLAEAQGGTVTAQSALGKGSRFTVVLPVGTAATARPNDGFVMSGTRPI